MSGIDTKRLIKFIDDKWRNSACPMCGKRAWGVSEKVFELREFNEGNLIIGGPDSAVSPVIPVTCRNCGNTVFINALSTRLLEDQADG